MMTPGWFEEWEAKRPALVETGLGDQIPGDVGVVLQQRGIDEVEFRTLVENTVEIIWSSFFGASDNEGSLRHLSRVISICGRRGIRPPPLEVFAESRFDEEQGWGCRLSIEQRNRWRASRTSAGGSGT